MVETALRSPRSGDTERATEDRKMKSVSYSRAGELMSSPDGREAATGSHPSDYVIRVRESAKSEIRGLRTTVRYNSVRNATFGIRV